MCYINTRRRREALHPKSSTLLVSHQEAILASHNRTGASGQNLALSGQANKKTEVMQIMDTEESGNR